MDISVNGQDYIGNYQFSFVDKLEIYRISPLAGPISGNTKIKLYGNGFNSSKPVETPVFVKIGFIEATPMHKSTVTNFDWDEDEISYDSNIPKYLLTEAEMYDKQIEDDRKVNKYLSVVTPDISRAYKFDHPDVRGLGGPQYVQIGEKVPIDIIDHNPTDNGFKQRMVDEIEVVYPDSDNLEFYFYREPFVKKIEPSSGLTSGGTKLEVTGAWFDEKPEYGVFPFCKIGNHVIRGQFIQTNRIICKTPPSEDTGQPSPVSVSLNGVDFKDSGFSFSYYQKPVIVDIQPRSGSIEGGTEIWLKGLKFSNITHGMKTVKCRFQ